MVAIFAKLKLDVFSGKEEDNGMFVDGDGDATGTEGVSLLSRGGSRNLESAEFMKPRYSEIVRVKESRDVDRKMGGELLKR